MRTDFTYKISSHKPYWQGLRDESEQVQPSCLISPQERYFQLLSFCYFAKQNDFGDR